LQHQKISPLKDLSTTLAVYTHITFCYKQKLQQNNKGMHEYMYKCHLGMFRWHNILRPKYHSNNTTVLQRLDEWT